MNLVGQVNFFTIAVYLGVLAVCVYAYMIHAVMRVVHLHPLGISLPRVWREHLAHFPDSKFRLVLAALMGASIICFLLST